MRNRSQEKTNRRLRSPRRPKRPRPAEKKTKFGGPEGRRAATVKVSPAGLRYGPGGARMGHRLKARAASRERTIRTRPGQARAYSDGGRRGRPLATIDEAYQLVKSRRPAPCGSGRKGTAPSTRVNLGRRIGYPSAAKKASGLGHPATRQVRLVLEGDKVITAFSVLSRRAAALVDPYFAPPAASNIRGSRALHRNVPRSASKGLVGVPHLCCQGSASRLALCDELRGDLVRAGSFWARRSIRATIHCPRCGQPLWGAPRPVGDSPGC